jgi:hypothetical protein
VTPKQPKARAGKAGSIDKERVNQLDEKLIAAEIEADLREARRTEEARIKSQSRDDVRKADQIIWTQLQTKKTDPMEPVLLENGGRLYGTKEAAIVFKPDRSVSLMRGSRSLKAEWKSIAGRLGAVDESIQRLTSTESPSHDRKRSRIDEFDGHLGPVVFELAAMPFDLNLPNTLTALSAILSETKKHTFELERDKLVRQINAAWAIRHKEARLHRDFLVNLKNLAQELGRPPTKGELARELGLSNNAQRMSQLCKALYYDWLLGAKSGPKPSKWKRRKFNNN